MARPLSRQLILCCDGTNNNLTGRQDDTNVTKLCELLAPDRENQLLWYDPGVGNPGELPGTTLMDSLGRHLERIYGLAFGKGIYENIAEGYSFLVRNYREGDEIYLYGFSRGAFTARSIAGLVTLFGLLRPDMQALVPTLLHTYFSDRAKSTRYKTIAAQINELFCADQTREVAVWFIGVWDTVASVGAPLLGQTISAKPSIVGKRFHHVRQALALDEHRRAFEPRPYIIEPDYDYAAHGQSIRQLWFSGSHCDVGGGYVNAQAALSDDALLWMVQESVDCGLRVRTEVRSVEGAGLDPARLQGFLRKRSGTIDIPRAVVHSETYDTPWWALGGLHLRDPQANPDWRRPEVRVEAVEHPSVEAHHTAFPVDTVWQRPRPLVPMLWAVAFALLFGTLAGAYLAPLQVLDVSSPAALLSSAAKAIRTVWAANAHLAHWQLTGWPGPHLFELPWPTPSQAGGHFRRLGAALLADLGLIASYAYLLARATSWAFAQIAGLRRVGMAPPTPVLNLLGLAGRTAVLGDLAENVATWLCHVGAGSTDFPIGEVLAGLAMSGFALMKWLGVFGCALLVVWAGSTLGVRSSDHHRAKSG